MSDLKCGNKVIITGFANADRQYRQKLLAMGLTPGTIVEIKRIAPLGDPIEIEVRNYALTLRRHEALVLMIEQLHE